MDNSYNPATDNPHPVDTGEPDLMPDTQRLALTVDKEQVKQLKMLAVEMDTQVSIVVRGLLNHGLAGLQGEDETITAAVEQAVSDEKMRRAEVGKRGMESRWGSGDPS